MAVHPPKSSSTVTSTTPEPPSLPSSPYDKHAYLVGLPLKHSISPTLHQALSTSRLPYKYGQIVRETPDLRSHLELMRADPRCVGSGVTMPFKVAVIPLLDDLTPEARAIGAVNTIFFRPRDPPATTSPSAAEPLTSANAAFVGTNTDCIGIRDAFLTNLPDPTALSGRPGLVVGGGGTVRAAIYALQTFLGCNPIYILNRDDAEVRAVVSECVARGSPAAQLIHVSSVPQARDLDPPSAAVSCIPNFAPATAAERDVREILTVMMGKERKGALLEMCYHPVVRTEIVELAEAAGWRVLLGTEALVGQGIEQARLWTGVEVDTELREEGRRVVREVVSGERALV